MEKITSTIPNSVIRKIKEDSQLITVYNLKKGYKPTLYLSLTENENGLCYEVISYGDQEIMSYFKEIPRNSTTMRRACEEITYILLQFFNENTEEDIAEIKIGNITIQSPLAKNEKDILTLLSSVGIKEA